MSAKPCSPGCWRSSSAARATGEEQPRLLAEFGGHLHVLEAAQVEMIEADRNYVAIRVGKDNFHARSTLQQAELALRSQPMLRISRSCLVNMNYVKEVNRTLRGDFILVLAGGATVTSSEGFRGKVKEYLGTLRLSSITAVPPAQRVPEFSARSAAVRVVSGSVNQIFLAIPARRSPIRLDRCDRAAATGSCRPR